MQTENSKKIAKLLRAAKDAHTKFTREHPDSNHSWTNWYAKYLLEQTDFSLLTSRDWSLEDLSFALEALDKSYQNSNKRQSWSEYYAARLLG